MEDCSVGQGDHPPAGPSLGRLVDDLAARENVEYSVDCQFLTIHVQVSPLETEEF
jgi:hypothetical protein